jgi:methionyl-tRNA formyltransferase
VAEAARRLALPLAEVTTVKSSPGFDALTGAGADVLAVVAYGEILPQAMLDLPRLAPVNLHFSLLPELRGAAPVQWAILEGFSVTGVTTIRMDAGMDTGPILLQSEEAIDVEDDAGSLGGRLAVRGARLLVDTFDRLEAGALRPRPQDEAKATYAPKLKPEDRIIDWTQRAQLVVRRIRALAPEPGARTSLRGRAIKVLRARSAELPDAVVGPAGSVVMRSRDGFAVAAGEGMVDLLEVAPEGRRRMLGSEFVRGYRPQVGEVLG